MNLYRVTYKQWNGSFSDMYDCEELSVGENEQEAIARVKEIVDSDAREFEAEKITKVFGRKIVFESDAAQKLNTEVINISTIASDINRQKIFDMVIEEACRQWCCFTDEAPERKTGEGFANFFYEIFKEKEQEYLENYKEIHREDVNSQTNITERKIESGLENNTQIIAAVDNDDNSIDIAVNVADEPLVTLNVSVNDDTITIRKWIGHGDSMDEHINIGDIYEQEQDTEITMQ